MVQVCRKTIETGIISAKSGHNVIDIDFDVDVSLSCDRRKDNRLFNYDIALSSQGVRIHNIPNTMDAALLKAIRDDVRKAVNEEIDCFRGRYLPAHEYGILDREIYNGSKNMGMAGLKLANAITKEIINTFLKSSGLTKEERHETVEELMHLIKALN